MDDEPPERGNRGVCDDLVSLDALKGQRRPNVRPNQEFEPPDTVVVVGTGRGGEGEGTVVAGMVTGFLVFSLMIEERPVLVSKSD